MLNHERYLVVVAHFDDEVLGCGGLIKKLTNLGKKVTVYIMTRGTTSRKNNIDKALYREKSRRVGLILGCDYVYGKYKDQRLDTVSQIEINQEIEKLVNGFKPDVVLTHYSKDINKDHQIVSESTKVACRPTNNCSVKELYEFPVISSSEFNVSNVFKADTYLDITNVITHKCEAMKQYNMEIKHKPKLRSEEYIKINALIKGAVINCDYAESYKTIKKIIK